MNHNPPFLFTVVVCAASLAFASPNAQGQTAQTAIAKSIGAIKTINGSAIILAPASGPEVTVNVQPNARILRLAPGDKDLKNATPLQLQELHVGDTIRARGPSSDGATSISALEIIVITRAAVEAVSDQMRQDWQKRGVDGLVKAVDPSSGTVTLSVPSFGGTKEISVHTSKETVIRRYPPGSANFADAKPSSLPEIRVNDQLRARGNRSEDGSELTAEEIVAGTFRNIAGTVTSVDASTNTITVQDLLSKKSVPVKVTSDSQLRKLPADAARLVTGFKGGSTRGASGSGSISSPSQGNEGRTNAPAPGRMGPEGGGAPGALPGGRAFDLNRVVSRMPAIGVGDLQKGDVVMIVAAEGPSGDVATKLLSGVESILQAAPSAGQALMLTPWNLGGGAPSGDN